MQAGLTWIFIVVSVVVFVADLLLGRALLLLGAKTTAIWSGEWYRLFTATFLHADLMHLAFNMYALYIFGQLVESLAGKRRFAVVYLLSGAFGYMASLWARPEALAIGASASIFGLMGYTLHYRLRRLPFRFLPIDSSFVQILVLNLVLGFIVPNIDQMAHVGGLLGGMLAASLVGVPNPQRKEERGFGEKIIAFTLVGVLSLMALQPSWTATTLRSVWPQAGQWVEARFGPFMAPLRAESIQLVWTYIDTGGEWQPAPEVLTPLPGRQVRLGVFWRWGRGTGALEPVNYEVEWTFVDEGELPPQKRVDKGAGSLPDADPELIRYRSGISAQPGLWTVRVIIEGREVFQRTVHIKTVQRREV